MLLATCILTLAHTLQDRFSSWCTGPCGCQGTEAVEPVEWEHEEDDEDEGVSAGSLECPEPAMAERLTMHLACAKSLAEKEVLIDIIHTLIRGHPPRRRLPHELSHPSRAQRGLGFHA